MRVLHFFKTYYPDSFGGIEQVIFQLAEGCREYGVDSQVLSLSQSGSSRNQLVANHLAHRSRLDISLASTSFSLSAFADFTELAADVDLIHYHFPWPFMDVVHFTSGIKKPSIVSYHSDIVRQKYLLHLYTPLMHRFLNSMQSIVASTPNYVATSPTLQRHIGKVKVIPYGLDRSTYKTPTKEKLKHWRVLLGPRFFLFVGMLRYYKGLDTLLDALVGSDYPLVIAGSGPVEQELKIRARQLGLSHVHFIGEICDEDKAALLELCYAFVFPSHLRSEAFGISLLEAAMYAKPLISCEIGTGTSYINLNGQTGITVPPNDALALRNALQQLWHDEQMSSEFGLAAQRRYQTHFSLQQMTGAYIEVYEEALSGHAKRPASAASSKL